MLLVPQRVDSRLLANRFLVVGSLYPKRIMLSMDDWVHISESIFMVHADR